jgi:outer membrane protein TolC
MVLMRDFHRRCLVTVGLGTVIACFPFSSTVASEQPELEAAELIAPQEVAQDDTIPLEEPVSEPTVDDPTPDTQTPDAEDPSVIPDTVEPDAEQENIVPTVESPTQPLQGDGEDSPSPTLAPEEQPVPLTDEELSVPFGEVVTDGDGVVSEPTIPPTEGLTDQGFEGVPDYLTPNPNPLLTPVSPEEVDIVGTQPISLETAIELAYRNNEQLQIAQLQLNQSLAGLREARAALYPTVDLTAGVQVANQASSAGVVFNQDDTSTVATGAVRTQYDLGLSGERSARIQAAEAQVRLAELAVEQTQAELRLATINEYYAVQQATAEIRINQAFLDEAERNLEDTQLREEVGVGTRFDVLRADVQVANARQQLTQAISQQQISQRQLARRLNVPPSINVTTLAVEIQGAWPLTLEESIVLAFQNRAEMERFLVERELNEDQRQIALSQGRPNVGLFARYELQDVLSGGGTGDFPLDDGFAIGAELTWLLFDGGAVQARAEQSEQAIRINESEFESIRNDIRLEVEEAYYTLLANRENIDTAKLAVQQAEEALELANLRFAAGVGTQLDVLSATSELTQARGNLVRAVLDYNRALARLERSVSNRANADDVSDGIDIEDTGLEDLDL